MLQTLDVFLCASVIVLDLTCAAPSLPATSNAKQPTQPEPRVDHEWHRKWQGIDLVLVYFLDTHSAWLEEFGNKEDFRRKRSGRGRKGSGIMPFKVRIYNMFKVVVEERGCTSMHHVLLPPLLCNYQLVLSGITGSPVITSSPHDVFSLGVPIEERSRGRCPRVQLPLAR